MLSVGSCRVAKLAVAGTEAAKVLGYATAKFKWIPESMGFVMLCRLVGEDHRKVLANLFKWLQRRSRWHRMNGWRF